MLWIDRVRSRPYQMANTISEQHHGENTRAEGERDVQVVGEDVGVQRSGDAQHDNRQPVRERHIARQAHLYDRRRPRARR